jgi:hypothetical protein
MQEKLIDNALTAYDRCKQSDSEWGMQYWTIVLRALMRKYSN